MARGAASGVGLLVVLAVGCSTSDPPPPAPSAACADTAPVPSGSVPAAVRDFDRMGEWYGADDLWVARPRVQDEPAEGYRTKYPSITLDSRGQVTGRKGAPRVEVERLDRSGSARGSSGSTGGLATADGGRQWWPTVVQFAGPGCWRVTETLGSTEVRFTVRVAQLPK
ncbi:hypothetical protein [Streptomyces acidiscabies]|uniref:hypothetical protein n=1 Tax=Streptomyces acidiscabies TaxID=42234 RepID=UPI00131D5282|nr:hypothetical protein [Streptomyces acidiscabies]